MSNRLSMEHSPYLLQHADNPVDWRPRGPEAFEEARRADKPVFLSIGYSTCHWCHVMAHESFEDEVVARAVNRGFLPVKVDREERPDGTEGKYYLLTPDEVSHVLGERDVGRFCRWYGVTRSGNFEGKSIPNLLKQPEFDREPERMAALREKVYAYRIPD